MEVAIKDILKKVRTGNIVIGLKLFDASRKVVNGRGSLLINEAIFYKKYVAQSPGDEIMNLDGKEFNVSELERQLRSLIGCGDVYIRFLKDDRPIVSELRE